VILPKYEFKNIKKKSEEITSKEYDGGKYIILFILIGEKIYIKDENKIKTFFSKKLTLSIDI
jgi:hypothetical protein